MGSWEEAARWPRRNSPLGPKKAPGIGERDSPALAETRLAPRWIKTTLAPFQALRSAWPGSSACRYPRKASTDPLWLVLLELTNLAALHSSSLGATRMMKITAIGSLTLVRGA